MTDAADIGGRLGAARRGVRVLDASWASSIASVADAYAVQAAIIGSAEGPPVGWKVSALTAADRAKFATDRAVAGVLLRELTRELTRAAPAELALSSFLAPLLECEIAFRLGRDLPAREAPYTRSEIEDAVDAVIPAFELPDSRWPPEVPHLARLADAMSNGAFVTGRPVTTWRGLDLGTVPIALLHDGRPVLEGSGARILGDPLLAVVALANAQPLPEPGLRAGQIVTTGTCTDPFRPEAGEYAATFGPLGEVRVRFVP